jgi:hypothetical protein
VVISVAKAIKQGRGGGVRGMGTALDRGQDLTEE